MHKRVIALVALLCAVAQLLCGCYGPELYQNGQTDHAIFYDDWGRILQRTEFNRLTKLTTVYTYTYTVKSKTDSTLIFAGVEMCTIDSSGNIIDEYTKDTFLRYDKDYAD